MNLKHLSQGTAAAAALTLAACGGGGGIGGSGDATGTLRVQITDAPACGYEAVNITIAGIRVHRSADAVDGDGGWVDLPLRTTRRINLLDLSNGVLQDLGETPLPAGRYTQMRLVLAENGGSTPLANSVVPDGRAETALTTPSAQQSGLKLNIDVDVPAGQAVDAVIDFDACKSVVKRGNSGRYNLKPVITVTPVFSAAGLRVVGYVSPALGDGFTNVSLQFDGVPVKATVPDANGRFVLYPVPAGRYDLVVTAPDRVTAVLTGVPVVDTAYTVLNTAADPIVPPLAMTPSRSVTGTVLPFTATVRALQFLSGGIPIELAWLPADDVDGSFAFSLPVDAPVRAAYASGQTLPLFAADEPVTGLYTLQAQSGSSVQEADIDVRSPVLPVVFPPFP